MKTKTTKLWLRSTSRYPKAECFILCRTALESVERSLCGGEVMPRIIVKLTNTCHGYCGRASWSEWEHTGKLPNRLAIQWKRVLVRVGAPNRFPCRVQYPRFKDMPEMDFRTYREAIVAVTAHETGHALGYSGRKEGEERCEMMAWDALDYYRKHQAEIDAEIEATLAEARQKVAKPTPEAKTAEKLASAEAKLKKWKRKLTLATNKVKLYTRQVRRLSKGQRMSIAPVIELLAQELAQAATPPNGSTEPTAG